MNAFCHLVISAMLMVSLAASASKPAMSLAATDYLPADSVLIERLLAEAKALPGGENRPLFFARKFLGRPYVAHTLEKNDDERLVVNTRELDCTTLVETVSALSGLQVGSTCVYLESGRIARDGSKFASHLEKNIPLECLIASKWELGDKDGTKEAYVDSRLEVGTDFFLERN